MRLKWIPLLAMVICFGILCVRGQAQNPSDEIIRVNTELVQTDVMVLDRRGRFVDGLKPEQFVLTLNGEAKPIAFLERVGSAADLAALSPAENAAATPASVRAVPTTSRVIFFFVDDAHLSSESVARARAMLSRFVESRISENDRVAIVSTSGQIGFLQQLTDDAAVLREAIARLNYKQNPEGYAGRTRISEYAASR